MDPRRARLIKIFKKLGCKDPEGWADSEIEEGFAQLPRYLFLRQAWRNGVIGEGDTSWIDFWRKTAKEDPEAPLSGIGPALDRLLAKKIDRKDLAEVVRVMQYETLFSLCYLLSDPGEVEPEVADVEWGLFEVVDERPSRDMGQLHEEVLGMDPTGREMRPKKRR